MKVCAKELEKGNITSIPFVLVDFSNFYEFGKKIEVDPATVIRYMTYINGSEQSSTGNSAELDGLVTSLL